MIPTPYYIVYEERLRRNLSLIKRVSEEADVKIIMAFKANALWKTFPVIAEYVSASTASSLNEMQLSLDVLATKSMPIVRSILKVHSRSFLRGSSHVTF